MFLFSVKASSLINKNWLVLVEWVPPVTVNQGEDEDEEDDEKALVCLANEHKIGPISLMTKSHEPKTFSDWNFTNVTL